MLDLPDDVLEIIFSQLDLRDIVNLSRVCKPFNRVVGNIINQETRPNHLDIQIFENGFKYLTELKNYLSTEDGKKYSICTCHSLGAIGSVIVMGPIGLTLFVMGLANFSQPSEEAAQGNPLAMIISGGILLAVALALAAYYIYQIYRPLDNVEKEGFYASIRQRGITLPKSVVEEFLLIQKKGAILNLDFTPQETDYRSNRVSYISRALESRDTSQKTFTPQSMIFTVWKKTREVLEQSIIQENSSRHNGGNEYIQLS